jgi:hypothetical protein
MTEAQRELVRQEMLYRETERKKRLLQHERALMREAKTRYASSPFKVDLVADVERLQERQRVEAEQRRLEQVKAKKFEAALRRDLVDISLIVTEEDKRRQAMQERREQIAAEKRLVAQREAEKMEAAERRRQELLAQRSRKKTQSSHSPSSSPSFS